MSDAATPAPIETPPASPPTAVRARWESEIELAEQEFKTWRTRVEQVLRRYIDDRGDSPEASTAGRSRRLNVLWSFEQTNRPALYLRTPKATVDRRYDDQDPLGRAAGQILQRTTQAALSLNQAFDTAMKAAVFDYQMGARGVSWVRYVPEFKKGDPDSIAWETVAVDYVHWNDFGHNPARTWDEVRFVYRRHYFTRSQCVQMFGPEIGRKITLDWFPKGVPDKHKAPNAPTHEMFAKATVYEIWDKPSRKRLWFALGYADGLAREDDDPLELERFFPCPRPLFGTVTTDSLVPIPDYTLWQDQALEIDDLTARIARIVKAIKVAGAYDKNLPELARIVEDTCDGELIPIDNWVKFAQDGGFKGNIDFLAIEIYVAALKVLIEARAQAKNDLYEATGQADIIRGASNPNETATAQRIKGQFATLRLQDRQTEVQRFARDNVEIVAEVIATKFQPATIAIMAGVDTASDRQVAEMFPQAIALLRNDMLRTFRIDVETDSMIAVDEQGEKQDATELVAAIGQYLERALPLAQAQPAMAPLLGQVLLFAVRRFRAGRELESTIEQALRQLEQAAKAPQQPAPDPKMAEVQARTQLEAQQHQDNMALERQKHADQMQLEREKMAAEREDRIALETRRIEDGAQARRDDYEARGTPVGSLDSLKALAASMGDAMGMLAQGIAALTAAAERQASAAEAPTVLEVDPATGRKMGRKLIAPRTVN